MVKGKIGSTFLLADKTQGLLMVAPAWLLTSYCELQEVMALWESHYPLVFSLCCSSSHLPLPPGFWRDAVRTHTCMHKPLSISGCWVVCFDQVLWGQSSPWISSVLAEKSLAGGHCVEGLSPRGQLGGMQQMMGKQKERVHCLQSDLYRSLVKF